MRRFVATLGILAVLAIGGLSVGCSKSDDGGGDGGNGTTDNGTSTTQGDS